mmetsp:Transcript_37175/g.72518  ORF Transcript_37175/g.72518 Transcript_37175/m.72518 type:complete len:278 (-) Transcript_37175:2205-3038(-)
MDEALNIELDALDNKLACLELGHVEHVVHDAHQLGAALQRRVYEILLLLPELAPVEERYAAHHAVEGVAKLVAEEPDLLCFGVRCRLCGDVGCVGHLESLELADVERKQHSAHAAPRLVHGNGAVLVRRARARRHDQNLHAGPLLVKERDLQVGMLLRLVHHKQSLVYVDLELCERVLLGQLQNPPENPVRPQESRSHRLLARHLGHHGGCAVPVRDPPLVVYAENGAGALRYDPLVPSLEVEVPRKRAPHLGQVLPDKHDVSRPPPEVSRDGGSEV